MFAEVAPGRRATLEYRIPAAHYAGTFWYHPHPHGSGSLQIADEDLSFHVSGLPPLESALVFYGGPGDPLPYWDGYLCVGAPQGLYRIGAPVHSAADGSLDLHVDWSGSPLAAGSGQVFPGSTWRFQAWYRDPGGPGGSGINFSDAVDLRFCP